MPLLAAEALAQGVARLEAIVDRRLQLASCLKHCSAHCRVGLRPLLVDILGAHIGISGGKPTAVRT
eukprot:5532372-Alexandrium_andersonii.AAC.1